ASLADLRYVLVRDEVNRLAEEIPEQRARATQFSKKRSELEQHFQALEGQGPTLEKLEKEWKSLGASEGQLGVKLRENEQQLSKLSEQIADLNREKIITERRVVFLREQLAELQKSHDEATERQMTQQQNERRATALTQRIDTLQA